MPLSPTSQASGQDKARSRKKNLGLIAGKGELPAAIAMEAKTMGYRVVAIALQPPADEYVRPHADEFHKVHIGRFGDMLKILKKASVTQVVMAGKVPKSLLYQNKRSLVPDLKALKFLFSLKDRSDDTLLKAVNNELRKEGLKLLRTTEFTKNLLTPEGSITKKRPAKSQMMDIELGWKIAREIGRLDIGQTVVMKGGAVMAVEAIEGTDEAVLRGGTLAKDNAVIIKVSRPQQDMKLDVPVVGLDTLKTMKKVKANVLALESGRSIIVDRERFTKEADRAGIAVLGISKEAFK